MTRFNEPGRRDGGFHRRVDQVLALHQMEAGSPERLEPHLRALEDGPRRGGIAVDIQDPRVLVAASSAEDPVAAQGDALMAQGEL